MKTILTLFFACSQLQPLLAGGVTSTDMVVYGRPRAQNYITYIALMKCCKKASEDAAFYAMLY